MGNQIVHRLGERLNDRLAKFKPTKSFETTISTIEEALSLRQFNGADFKLGHVLGSGSFGLVVSASLLEKTTGFTGKHKKTYYALKAMSKTDVIEEQRLPHIKAEREILSLLDSPFILKLYGTYQTPHQIVLVTESINNGDMWSVIYEQLDVLPLRLIKFYTASIVLALSFLHSNGVMFRDLKPENIMIDSKGHIRIVDFGFAKQLPFTVTDANTGKSVRSARTFTICGTPHYMAPEVILNLGHDFAVDLWSLGVILFELFTASTPFSTSKERNLRRDTLSNISATRFHGVSLPVTSCESIEERCPHGKHLILQLLREDPPERLGATDGTHHILSHAFLADIDTAAIARGVYNPVYIPSPPRNRQLISAIICSKNFTGDQSLFDFF